MVGGDGGGGLLFFNGIIVATCTEFEVTVETGTKRLAGTSGNVYIALQGTEGVTYKYHLNSLNSNGMCFQRGQTDKFRIKVFNIGDIRSLRYLVISVAESV